MYVITSSQPSAVMEDEYTRLDANRRSCLLVAWIGSAVAVAFMFAAAFLLMIRPAKLDQHNFVGPVYSDSLVGDKSLSGSFERPEPLSLDGGRVWLVVTEDGVIALSAQPWEHGCLTRWKSDQGKFIEACRGNQHEFDGSFIQGPHYKNLDRHVIVAMSGEGDVVAETNEHGDPMMVPPGSRIYVDMDRKIPGETPSRLR